MRSPDHNLKRCLYTRFKHSPNCVTKVLQTLLRYLDRRERAETGNWHLAICTWPFLSEVSQKTFDG
jgi:hypothetical protein